MIKLNWDENVKNRLIGRNGKYYAIIRNMIENIVYLEGCITHLDNRFNTYNNICKEFEKTSEYDNYVNFEYKNERQILEYKLDEALLNLEKFKNVSLQIPNWGGQITCILDYIMHGLRWVYIEIKSKTIYKRMNEQNAIAYIKEAEILFGRKII